MTNEEKINLIGQKILLLSNNLDRYQAELNQLKQQLEVLQQGQIFKQQPIVSPPIIKTQEPKIEVVHEIKIGNFEIKSENIPVGNVQEPNAIQQQNFQIPPQALKQKTASNFNFEEFIGGKLITIDRKSVV